MPPCNCHHPFPRPEPFSPLPRPGKVPDWGKWIRDRLAEKGALLAFPSVNAFPDPGAGPNLYLAEDTDIVYRWDGAHYQVVFDPDLANDVLEYEDRGHFPEAGHHGKLYIAADTGSLYRWDDTDYAELLPGKADKVVPAAEGNLAALDAQGNLADSGAKPADFATAAQGAKADTAVQPGDITGFVDGAAYDAEYGNPPKPTILLKHGNEVVATVDAAAFVIDGMVSNVQIVDGNLVITFNTDSGKQPISIPLTDIFNPANYYTKTETNALLAGKKNNFDVGTGLVEVSNTLYAYRGVAGTSTEGETRYTIGPAGVGSTVYSWNGSAAVPTGDTVTMINTTIGRIYTVAFPNPVYYDRSATDDIVRPDTLSIDESVVAKKTDIPTTLPWSAITDKPQNFTPSAHASTHASNGSDPITPSAIGAVPTSRTVNGTALSSDVTLTGADIAVSGNDATKISAALAGKASKADATLTERFSEWNFADGLLEAAQENLEGYLPPSALADSHLEIYSPSESLQEICLVENGHIAGDSGHYQSFGLVSFSPDQLSALFYGGMEWFSEMFPDDTTVATRTALQGYQLGSQTDKPLASEAEAEALRTGKQNALSTQQLANIAAVSNALAFDATHSYAAGDPVVYNGTLYTFTAAHTGAWTGSDVSAVDIIARLAGKLDKSGGTVYTLTARFPITVGSSGNERTYGVNSISRGSSHIDFPSSTGTIALTAGTGHAGNLAALDANGNPTDSGLPKNDVESLLFAQYYPDGSVKSAAEFTPGIKYDTPDTTNRTIMVKPFCNTGTAAYDNSALVGRVVIPPFVDAQRNGYISDDGTRFKVVGVSSGAPEGGNQNLTAIVAPNTVTSIDDYAFSGCTALITVSLPAVMIIDSGVFSGCTALAFIALPAATSIEGSAFDSCTSLVSVSLPALTSIVEGAFASCTSLASVDFGDAPRPSVPSLGYYVFSGVPTSCKIIVPYTQYDEWKAAENWCDLPQEFVRHAEKADKPATFTTGNLAALDANGNPTDSGVKASDKLDASSASAPFSSDSSTQYAVGSHCTYQGKLYKCTTATTGGTWDASKWTADTMTDPDAVLDITAQNQLRVVAKDGTVLWAQGYDLASTSSATLACDATNNFTFADGATTQAFTLPTAPTGKAGDFGLDIDNSANTGAATISFTNITNNTASVVIPKGENLNDMLAIAAGELARFYISLSTFRVNNLPTWHIVKQVVENGGAQS